MKTAGDIMFQKLSESLESTSKLTQLLLSEMRESESEFAAVKTELSILRDNFKELSSIIREGNGAVSVITRIALIEQKLDTINKWIDAHADLHMRTKSENDKLIKTVESLEDRIDDLEKYIADLKADKKKAEDDERASLHKQKELDHIAKLNSEKTKALSAETYQKIAVAIFSAAFGLLAAYLTKLL